MNSFLDAIGRKSIGIFLLIFGMFFLFVVVGIFSTSGMDYEKKQMQEELAEEFGGEIEIEFNNNFFSPEENAAMSIVKYMFSAIGLLIAGAGLYLVISGYKIERRQRENLNINAYSNTNTNININTNLNPYVNPQDSMDYGQNYGQSRTYNLNGKVYDKDDNSLGF